MHPNCLYPCTPLPGVNRVAPTALLVKGDAVFCEEVAGCDLDELNAFETSGKHLSFFQGSAM